MKDLLNRLHLITLKFNNLYRHSILPDFDLRDYQKYRMIGNMDFFFSRIKKESVKNYLHNLINLINSKNEKNEPCTEYIQKLIIALERMYKKEERFNQRFEDVCKSPYNILQIRRTEGPKTLYDVYIESKKSEFFLLKKYPLLIKLKKDLYNYFNDNFIKREFLLFTPESIVDWNKRKKEQYAFTLATKKLKEGYNSNNQRLIFEACEIFTNLGELGNFRLIGFSNNRAYAGVLPFGRLRHKNLLANKKNNELSPEIYAKKLAKIKKEGYLNSRVPLDGNFLRQDLMDVGNIYFQITPHLGYGGDIALFSWNLSNYCLFTKRDEHLIITSRPIPSKELTLYIRKEYPIDNSNKYFEKGTLDRNSYLQRLRQELQRLKVPFELM